MSGKNNEYSSPFRSNNIAFMKYDQMPYKQDLSQYVRTNTGHSR